MAWLIAHQHPPVLMTRPPFWLPSLFPSVFCWLIWSAVLRHGQCVIYSFLQLLLQLKGIQYNHSSWWSFLHAVTVCTRLDREWSAWHQPTGWLRGCVIKGVYRSQITVLLLCSSSLTDWHESARWWSPFLSISSLNLIGSCSLVLLDHWSLSIPFQGRQVNNKWLSPTQYS